MPTLATVAGMAILIYYADHAPPHFHVRAPNFRAKVTIADLSVSGRANTKLLYERTRSVRNDWSRCSKLRIDQMLHKIARAVPKADYSVKIHWDDGSHSEVSFAELVGRGVCKPMKDSGYFTKRITVADDGCALAWPNEVEFSADSLWYKTHPQDARKDIEAAD